MTTTLTYLSSRGITIAIPRAIRHCPNLYHPRAGISTPAMLAAVQRPDGHGVALQATHLSRDGRKAAVDPVRRTFGKLGTGAVRLARAGEELGLAEGVETALSAMQLTGVPCWATLGAVRMARITLPAIARRVVVFADNDVPGRDAAAAAAARYQSEGRQVEIRLPPDGYCDWNDVLQARRRAA